MDDLQIPVANDNPKQTKKGTVKIVSFNRSTIRVKLETVGVFIVSVVDSNGDIIRSFSKNYGRAGINTISWDGSFVPDGRYAISVEHNGSVSGVNILLK